VLVVAGLLGLAACGSAKRHGSTTGQIRCDRSSAYSLIRQLPVQANPGPYVASDQVICADLTGSGRQDLIASVWDAMDHGAHYWAAWRNEGSKWIRIAFSGNCCQIAPHKFGMGIGVRRSSRTGQFLVSQPIYRSKDPACCASGGTAVARWAWKQGALRIVGHR
jgi:hypothetical protein